MHRSSILILTFVLCGAIVSASASVVLGRADSATPEPTPSVLAETLASSPLPDLPGQALLQLRVTLAPGAVVPEHIHPGNLVFSVESGTITYEAVEESALVMWAGPGTPAADQTLLAGEEVTLEVGDWLAEQRGTIHVVRNSGDTSAVLLISAVVAADEPFLQPVEEVATPAS